MEKVLQHYLRRLNNLSGNNRSLLLLRLMVDQFMDLHEFDFVENMPSFHIIKELIAQQKQIPLCSDVSSRARFSNEMSRGLKKIQRTDQFLFEERGAKDLYVGWPFINGKFSDDTPVRCPLVFFPVTIEKKENTWFLLGRNDVNITLNKTFLLAYAYYNNVKPDEDLIETVIDGYDKDDLVFRTNLYELLKNSNVAIHFNQENFTDKLIPFRHYQKAEFEKEGRTGILKMYPEAVLGIFPQAGSYLVPDYLALLESAQSNDPEDFFTKRVDRDKLQMSLFNKLSEENTFTPFLLDAYQEKAIKEVKKGNSIVVQGPPGTGKSQLISNLICDFIARGKNVLLVCQKRAALDVAYDRLKQKEVHRFVALVHDFKNDRKSIFEQINRQIESVDLYQKKNNSLDSIPIERAFLHSSRRIDQLSEELEEFREALFNESECGRSVKELYLTSSPDKPNFSMNLEYRAFRFDCLQDTLRRFTSYLQYYERFEKQAHFWSKGPSFADFQAGDLMRLKEIIHDVPEYQNYLLETSEKFASRRINFEAGDHFSGKIPEIEELISHLKDAEVFKVYQYLVKKKPTKDLNWLIQIERKMMACFKGPGLEFSLKADELGRLQKVLVASIGAGRRLLGYVKWQFSKEKTFLKRALVANQLKSGKKNFSILTKKVDNRLNFEHITSEIKQNKWLSDFPEGLRKIEIQDWFYLQKASLNSYTIAEALRSIHEYISVIDHKQYLAGLNRLKKLASGVSDQVKLWSRHVNLRQVRKIVLGEESADRLKKSLQKDFDAICEYHKLIKSLSTEESQVLNKVIDPNPSSVDEALSLFINSLSLAWIEHIECKYPILRSVSSGKLDNDITELREVIVTKRKSSKEILLQKVRERTYKNLAHNRLKNRITYRNLQHQVTKKRRIWPIRKVVGEFTEELIALLPCWMCSPESASAIFPMSEHFDLVIFDEASQCFAERGIPAMYRGKQLVIAGDSKQLQPSDLYRGKWEEDYNETPALAIESLLDLAKYYLPEITLSGHYRSKSLELIEFSNEQFYGGRLKLLPDYDFANKPTPAIRFVSTKGIWEDGSNPIEAGEAVALVMKLLQKSEGKGIGIITFNFKQQNIILDLLEEAAEKEQITIPHTLFVKNIENVQGDERDIVIFSTGYAPDKKGRVKLRFGSLNTEGGENRLNVAITRAKECIYVLSSIHPSQLHTDNTKNNGPKLLKKYLEYAWNISNNQWSPHIPVRKDHHVDWFLRNKLQDLSFHEFPSHHLAKELPFADLSVRRENKYTGLILTDDEQYFQALSPKQIYAFQHFHLSMKEWPHIRFHSRELWIDRLSAKEKIRKFLYAN